MYAFSPKQVIFVEKVFDSLIIKYWKEKTDIELEFDQKNIKSLKLTIRWRFKPDIDRKATKYVLFYEIGKVNVFNNYAIEYSAPELLDDGRGKYFFEN